MSVRGEERSRKRYAVRDDESVTFFGEEERRSERIGEERSRKRYEVRDDEFDGRALHGLKY